MSSKHIQVLIISLLAILLSSNVAGQDDDEGVFQYIKGPVPDEFVLGQHYPDRNETVECRPIRLRIERDSNQFRSALVVNNNGDIIFTSSDARIMSSRLQIRLNRLAELYYEDFEARLTVLLSWVDYQDNVTLGNPYSLHYEGEVY